MCQDLAVDSSLLVEEREGREANAVVDAAGVHASRPHPNLHVRRGSDGLPGEHYPVAQDLPRQEAGVRTVPAGGTTRSIGLQRTGLREMASRDSALHV